MKNKKITVIAIATILSLGMLGACGNKVQDVPEEVSLQANTTNSTPKVTTTADATNTNTETIRFNTENGIAIRGTDTVAYFQENKVVKGTDKFTHQWMNATWKFASAENRDLFASNPKKYAPQYGGFCAWAVSQGYTAPIDPNAWKIVNGKLYLNFSKSVQKTWSQDIPGNIAKADSNWPGVLNK